MLYLLELVPTSKFTIIGILFYILRKKEVALGTKIVTQKGKFVQQLYEDRLTIDFRKQMTTEVLSTIWKYKVSLRALKHTDIK